MQDVENRSIGHASDGPLKVLIIVHGFALENPRSFRWRAVAQNLTEQGHKVSVVHAAIRRIGSRATAYAFDVHPVLDAFSYFVGDEDCAEGTRSASEADAFTATPWRRVSSAILNVIKQCVRFARWPDYAFLWTVPALLECRRLQRARSFDAMISVSHPFSCHLVGLWMKQLWPGLHWVVDCGDPFAALDETPPNNRRLYNGINHHMEHLCFSRAAAISVTSQSAKDLYERLFRDCADKTTVIPPLLGEVESAPFAFAPAGAHQRVIRVVFAGSLYASIRHPERALEFFRQLPGFMPHCHFDVHFVGRLIGAPMKGIESAFRSAPTDNVSYAFHGLKPRAVARGMIDAADCLLNISNTTAYQLPSKLVELVASGKPVINLTTTGTDASCTFLQTYRASLTVVGGRELHEEERSAIKTFFDNMPTVPDQELHDLRMKFSAAAIGRQYSDLLGLRGSIDSTPSATCARA